MHLTPETLLHAIKTRPMQVGKILLREPGAPITDGIVWTGVDVKGHVATRRVYFRYPAHYPEAIRYFDTADFVVLGPCGEEVVPEYPEDCNHVILLGIMERAGLGMTPHPESIA